MGLNLGYWGMGNDADNLALAREADRLGYSVVWAAEAYGSDSPTVLAWVAAKAPRIDVGRGAEVRDHRNRLIRTNHVVFTEGAGDVNQTVSRKHAHIAYEPLTGHFRLHDDGSEHGTEIVRGGRTISVLRGTRGVRLQSDDDVVLGEARVRIRFPTA